MNLNSSGNNHTSDPRRIQSLKCTNVNILNRKESGIQANNAPWRSLVKNLTLNIKDASSLLNQMNINWVKSKAKRFPPGVKIPFLVLVVKEDLESISLKSNRNKTRNCVKLMDHSGTITGALDGTFIETFGDKVMLGTSLALRNVRFHCVIKCRKKGI